MRSCSCGLKLSPGRAIVWEQKTSRGFWGLKYDRQSSSRDGPHHSDVYSCSAVSDRCWSLSHSLLNTHGSHLNIAAYGIKRNKAEREYKSYHKKLVIFPSHMYHWARVESGAERAVIASHFRTVEIETPTHNTPRLPIATPPSPRVSAAERCPGPAPQPTYLQRFLCVSSYDIS